MHRFRRSALWLVLPALLTLTTACQVTWRQPDVQPVNPVVVLPAPLEATCAQLRDAIGFLGGAIDNEVVERDACLYESGEIALLRTADAAVRDLDEVAYVTDNLSRGRYHLTLSARPTSSGDTRIRISTRIEGYDGGSYRLLRSRGLIERTLTERVTEVLEVEPVAGSTSR